MVSARPHCFKLLKQTDLLRLGLGLGQRGQQHGGQNGDDGNDHQQFNERKAAGAFGFLVWIMTSYSSALNFSTCPLRFDVGNVTNRVT